MIKSMTGFGHGEYADEKRKIIVEMKAVNHRYLDVGIKMPKKMNFFESQIRLLLKKYVQRGKIDIFISYEDYMEGTVTIRYNEQLARQYMDYLGQMAEQFSLENDMKVSQLSRYPEVFVMEEQPADEEELWEALSQAVMQATGQFVKARETEGQSLKNDILEKCRGLLTSIEFIEKRSPQIIAQYRAKLEDKVKELLGDVQIDENRLAAEVVIFADKICVDEETVRLRSHIQSVSDTLQEGGPAGRKLDFIAQEMNREANTILSKANDLDISQAAISLKTDIEKIREQIQNIE